MTTMMMDPTTLITDQFVATELLSTLKASIKNLATALTEVATTDIRNMLMQHFNDAVFAHGKLTDLMIQRGWYQAYHPGAQVQVDIKNASMVLHAVQH